jgi:hypothetical protein
MGSAHGMLIFMAQSRSTHKGAREQLLPQLAEPVHTELVTLAADHNTDVGQAGADLLAIATGYPELVRRLHQTVLSHSRVASSTASSDNGKTRPTKIRVPQAVYADLRAEAARRGTKPGPLSADLLAIATGHPELVREFDKEVLPLAM